MPPPASPQLPRLHPVPRKSTATRPQRALTCSGSRSRMRLPDLFNSGGRSTHRARRPVGSGQVGRRGAYHHHPCARGRSLPTAVASAAAVTTTTTSIPPPLGENLAATVGVAGWGAPS